MVLILTTSSMCYPNSGTYLEQFWIKPEISKIRQEILNEEATTNITELFVEKAIEDISDKAMFTIQKWRWYEVLIQNNLNRIAEILTPTIIEQYTWWVPCLERTRDLHDELYINQNLYNWFLIEAKLCLQELEKFQEKNLQRKSYIEILLRGWEYRNSPERLRI